ncbi:unnamed protein product [Cladocopium goreaui]|uniref:DJ-1/PfpI domain-containing protein n=1 Tax=Cladocopium goreaui TaxID=2562237 RepID=A0A9P1BGA9_9DINO|nr:unnamed protein product [Cladocopium goreaui]
MLLCCPIGFSGLQSRVTSTRVLVPAATRSDAVTAGKPQWWVSPMEMSVACLTDVLTRAGADVTLASVEKTLELRLNHGITVVADVFFDSCAQTEWAAIASPGGEGSERLADCTALIELLRLQRQKLRPMVAVGESPAELLAAHQLLEFDEKATSYPSARLKKVIGAACAGWWDANVVVDRKVVTSQGPGTAMACALKLVELLFGAQKASALSSELLCPCTY